MNQLVTTLTEKPTSVKTCPLCGVNRAILKDMYYSKGHSRRSNQDRKAEARRVTNNCPLCQSFVLEVKN